MTKPNPIGLWEKKNVTKAANTVEEKALAAARKIESISFHNKPHVDVSDTVAYEHRFWTTHYILVSGMPFIDEYDALLGAFYKPLRNQKLDIDAERSKYTSSALDSIPRKNRGPNSPPVESEIFKNRAMLTLKEVFRRIWAAVYFKWSRIQTYWLKVQHGANEKWVQEWHDIYLLTQNLRSNLKTRLHFIDTTFLGEIVPNVRRIDLVGFRETILHPDIEDPDKMGFVFSADEMDFEWTSPAEVDHEPIMSRSLPRFLKTSADPR